MSCGGKGVRGWLFEGEVREEGQLAGERGLGKREGSLSD